MKLQKRSDRKCIPIYFAAGCSEPGLIKVCNSVSSRYDHASIVDIAESILNGTNIKHSIRCTDCSILAESDDDCSLTLTLERVCVKCTIVIIGAICRHADRIARIQYGGEYGNQILKHLYIDCSRGDYIIDCHELSVHDYAQFVNATGYVSSSSNAAKDNQEHVFDNRLYRVSDRSQTLHLSNTPIACISPVDAFMYSRWSGRPIPSDEQWVDASIVYSNIVDSSQYVQAMSKALQEAERIYCTGYNIISTMRGDTCLARSCPLYYKSTSPNDKCTTELKKNQYTIDTRARYLYCIDISSHK